MLPIGSCSYLLLCSASGSGGTTLSRECFRRTCMGHRLARSAAQAAAALTSSRIFCKSAGVRDWHGGLRQCASLGAYVAALWAYGAADGAAVCEAVCEDEKKRCRRRGGDLRSGGPAEHALRTDQEHRAAGDSVSASGASGLCEGPHRAGQPDP